MGLDFWIVLLFVGCFVVFVGFFFGGWWCSGLVFFFIFFVCVTCLDCHKIADILFIVFFQISS